MYNDTLINTGVKLEGFNNELMNRFCKKKAIPLKEVALCIHPLNKCINMNKYNVQIRDIFCGL